MSGDAEPPALPWVIAAALVVFGACLRLPGLFTDLQLDEVWSLTYAAKLSAPWGVFTEVHHDSNHWLNTLFLYLLGDRPDWIYRLPAYFCGALSVAMAWRASAALTRRSGALLEPSLAALLVASSFPLVFYGSEARGYGTLILFVLVALDALLRYAESGALAYKVVYWLATILGFLSHLVFVHLFAAAVVWALVALRRDAEQRLPDDLLRLNVVPIAFLGILFLVDLQHLTFGGGPDYSLLDVVTQAASIAVGGPHRGLLAAGAALGAALALAGQLRCMARRGDDRWVLLGVATVGFPAAITLAARPAFLFPRYYLVGIVLIQLVLALGLGRALRGRRPLSGVAAVALLVLSLTGHTRNLRAFWERGRGHYREAVTFIAKASSSHETLISGDHTFRTQTLLDHYQRHVGVTLTYVADPGPRGVEWWIAHSQDPVLEPAPELKDPAGNAYALERSYPCGELSGFRWFVYSRSR